MAIFSRYLLHACQGSPRDALLHSALDHLDLAIREQTLRRGSPAESATLLYAEVCMALGEGLAVARRWAGASYREVRLEMGF